MKILKSVSTAIISAIIITGILVSCNSNNKVEEYEKVLVKQEEIFLETSEEMLAYCYTALDYLDTFIKDPDYNNLKNARIACVSALHALDAVPNPDIIVTDEIIDYYVSNNAGDMAALPTRVTMTESDKSDLILKLNTIIPNLSGIVIYTEDGIKQISDEYSYFKEITDWYTTNAFLNSNYFMALTMSEENCLEVKTHLAEKFPVFFNSGMQWETDADTVQENIDKWIDKYEEFITDSSVLLGKSEAYLEQEQQGKKSGYIVFDGHPETALDPLFFYTSDKTIKYAADTPSETEYEASMKCIDEDGKMYITCENVSTDEYFDYLYELMLSCSIYNALDSFVTDESVKECIIAYHNYVFENGAVRFSIGDFIKSIEEDEGISRDEYSASCKLNGYDFSISYKADGTVQIVTSSDFSFMPTANYLK